MSIVFTANPVRPYKELRSAPLGAKVGHSNEKVKLALSSMKQFFTFPFLFWLLHTSIVSLSPSSWQNTTRMTFFQFGLVA